MAMKKTNVVLDQDLVAEAKAAAGVRFTKDIIDLALRRLVRNSRRRRILRFAGKIEWAGDLDKLRRGRHFG